MRRVVLLATLAILSVSCADLKRAEIYYKTGKYEEAGKELKPLANRKFPKAYYLLGKLIAEGKLSGVKKEEAISYLEKAYESGIWKSARLLGMLYKSLGKYEEAIRWLQRGAEKGDLPSRIALLKLKLQLLKVSPEEIAELERLTGRDPQVLSSIGNYYLKMGKYDLAEKYFSEAYSKGVLRAGLQLAKVYLKESLEEKAEELLKEVYYKSGSQKAAFILGKIYERRAKNLKPGVCLLKVSKTPQDYFLKRLSLDKERETYFLKAKIWYRKALPLLDAEYRLKRIEWIREGALCEREGEISYYAAKDVETAVSDLKKCRAPKKTVRTEPEDIEKSCALGKASAEIKLALKEKDKNPDLAGAVLYYYAKERRIPRAMVALAELYLDNGYPEKAFKWLKEAVDLDYLPAIRKLASYLLEEGNESEAVKYLLLLEKKGFCSASLRLGSIYEGDYGNLVDFERALHHYRLAAEKGCLKAYYKLAKLSFLMGDLDRALSFAEKFLKESGDSKEGNALVYRIYLAEGNFKKAAVYFEKAVRSGYVPPYNDLKTLLPYISPEILTLQQVRDRLNVILAEKFSEKDFKLAFCLAYEATFKKVPRAALLLYRFGALADTEEKALFIEEVKKKPETCRLVLARGRKKILSLLSKDHSPFEVLTRTEERY
jgi:TPR repeat protein